MRALAAGFSVVAGYGAKGENKETLRLMPTPIYRYQSAGQGVADGAIFNFAKGTDPEASFNAGLNHLREGRATMAVDEFKKAVRQDGKNAYFQATGSRIRNLVSPGRDSTLIEPPCRSVTMRWLR